MNFKAYSKLNTIIGWIVFAIAAFTYLSTMERTVSLWDCGEFVSCAYKMQVPHPPGAPMFILIYHMFTIFATDPSLVPLMTNAASALSSAFTILFLFWTVTALAVKMLVKPTEEDNIPQGNIYAVLGAGVVGALAYTFSDTFWFSAVEGEVYALSSMFTALVFWLALKWERRANERHNLRWLILIFYLVGVVIGIHLLGLLVIPVVVLMYYYKKYDKVTPKGVLIALGIGFVTLGLVQIGTIQWLPAIGSWFELLFVNSFHLPYWSGIIFFFALLFAVAAYFVWYTHKRGMVMANTIILCFVSVVIGYTSYATTVIRSYANPPIDMNDPEDVFTLISYLSREQYGDNYLVSGPYYTAFTKEGGFSTKEGGKVWRRDVKNNQYVEAGNKTEYDFSPKYTTMFPRMFHGEAQYLQGYRYWGNVGADDRISFGNNLRFFVNYQLGYMYGRYFAWNFIGRQNDVQGMFDEFHQGNWLTGIDFIDQNFLDLGPQDNLPVSMAANKANNKLYALPFILGLLGFAFQFQRNRKDFWVTFFFFFMTGLAIALYLNMPSPQPRERDYAFVGSFYVYAIWIGLGVLFLYDLFKKKMALTGAAIAASALSLVAVPVLMAAEEWNDHDRSKRTASLDYGVNYLQSCDSNAVFFTNGDNDTYPLWYAQEVEGIRNDVRIVNLSLFGTDWYINQMREPINNAPALTFTLTPEQTLGWDFVPYYGDYLKNTTDYIDIVNVLKFIGSGTPDSRLPFSNGKMNPFMPTRKLRLKVNKENAIRSGAVKPEDAGMIDDYINIDITKSNIIKNDLMVLDFIATNNFKLPVYFSITSGPDEYLNLGQYLQQEGLAYRLTPVKQTNQPVGRGDMVVNSEIMYDNVMNKFRWGKLDQNETYVDYVLMRQSENMRGIMEKLASQLMAEGQMEKAVKVADKCLEVIPHRNVPYDFYNVTFVDVYYSANQKEKGDKLAKELADIFVNDMNYYNKLKPSMQTEVKREMAITSLYGIDRLYELAKRNNNQDLIKQLEPYVSPDARRRMQPQQPQPQEQPQQP